jgi:hypothetical protein
LFISNLQASNVAAGINLPLPHALDCALNAIIPSEIPFLDVEAIVAEIVSNGSINTSVFKIISIIQSNFYFNNDYMNENIHESIKKVHE